MGSRPDLPTLAAVPPQMAEILKDAIAGHRKVDKQRVTLVTVSEMLTECAGETNLVEQEEDENTTVDTADSDVDSLAPSIEISEQIDEGDITEDSSLDW